SLFVLHFCHSPSPESDMGCGSSRGEVINSVSSPQNEQQVKEGKRNKSRSRSNGKVDDIADNHNKEDGKCKESINSTMSEASTIPAHEKYQNGAENGVTNNPLGKLPPLKPSGRIGFLDQNTNDDSEVNQNRRSTPVAFEVPAEEGEETGGVSLIKRHPPRRLRKMVEDQVDEALPVTHEAIQEKVLQANERRNMVLHQRVASARQKSGRVHKPLFDSGGFNPNDYGGEIETAEKDESSAPDYL
ncbi:unnamed protein product, partial [Allacma fusca]